MIGFVSRLASTESRKSVSACWTSVCTRTGISRVSVPFVNA